MSVDDHLTGEPEQLTIEETENGHGSGDFGLTHGFVNAIRGVPDDSLTTARESLESHLLAFAAEESRLEHRTINMDAYRARVETELNTT